MGDCFVLAFADCCCFVVCFCFRPVSKFTATERLAIVKEIHSGLQLKQSMQAISENIRKNMPEVKEKHSLQSVIGIVSSWIPVLQYMASQIPNCTEDLLVQRFQAFERAGGRTRGNPHLKRHVRVSSTNSYIRAHVESRD